MSSSVVVGSPVVSLVSPVVVVSSPVESDGSIATDVDVSLVLSFLPCVVPLAVALPDPDCVLSVDPVPVMVPVMVPVVFQLLYVR